MNTLTLVCRCLLIVILVPCALVVAQADDEAALTVEQLAAKIQQSLVVIEGSGRSGQRQGEGTGFAIGEDLVATARHVIGEGRPVSILLPNGQRPAVRAVYSQRAGLDLVILQTAEPHGMPALTLSDEEAQVAEPAIALGHPHGLRNSVVDGIVSGRREIDGISMLQLAMAIEPGNSGGPVVNRDGVVTGIVTLKSAETDNIGFAIPVSHLQGLVESPNPIPMERWVTIGALNRDRWEVIAGAQWKQRAGRILVDGIGTGFGGRTLCISRQIPELPVEVQVDVRMSDERGAAGLVLHSDGADRHYGFYPSAGNLRFTRFNGPDVNSWTILHNEPHAAWQPGEWNTLKVRIENEGMQCFVNGQPAFETTDQILAPGRPGLAAFRGTEANFRNFRIAATIPSTEPSDDQRWRIDEILSSVAGQSRLSRETIRELSELGSGAGVFLEQRAQQLESQAERLRQLADDVHTQRVARRLLDTLSAEEGTSSNLLEAALLVAKLDNSEVRPEIYVEAVDQMANDIRHNVEAGAGEAEYLAALDDWLFQQNGFRGSEQQYYTRSNSYLNEVIDDREGLPIALSVLYIALAERLDLNVRGVGLPGHYIVRFDATEGADETQWIDVFHRGKRMTDDDIHRHLRDRGLRPEPRFLDPQQPAQIIERMLQNLLGLAERDRNDQRVLRYLEVLVRLSEDNPEFRAKRLEMRARTGHPQAALEDADWFVEHQPEGINLPQLERLRQRLQMAVDEQ